MEDKEKKEFSAIDKVLKDIKAKLTGEVTDDEIVGQPDWKNFSKRPDLIPLSSMFSLQSDDPLSKKLNEYFDSLNDSYDRDERYERYRVAMKQPEIDGALDIYASETITQAEDGSIINVFCSNQKVVDIVSELFARVGMADKAYGITKNFCGFGDEFFENIFSKSGKKILSINEVPRDLIGRQEKNGVLQNFFLRKNKKIKKSEENSLTSTVLDYNAKDEAKKIDPFRILHWRIPNSETSPYGRSILETVIGPIEELKLMEQALILARISRAPERRVYNVNVGSTPGEKGIAMAREVVSRLKNKNIINNKLGGQKNLDSTPDFMGAVEDIVIPFRKDEQPSTIDTLAQLNAPGDLPDLEFIRDRIFPGLGIPRQYLFDDTFANANTNLSNKSIQFAKRIRRIQKFFAYPLYKLAFIELRLHGINPKEYKDLVITLNNPSNVDIKEKIDVETQRWTLINTIRGANTDKVFYNDFYTYKEILNFSNDEILQLMIQNSVQQKAKNPFSFLPKEERPDGFEILDQLSGDMEEGAGAGETDANANDIPDEAETTLGAPPAEGEEPATPTEEPAEEPITASYKRKSKENEKAIFEAIKKAKLFSDKKKKESERPDQIFKNVKYTVNLIKEEYLKNSGDLKGLQTLAKKDSVLIERFFDKKEKKSK